MSFSVQQEVNRDAFVVRVAGEIDRADAEEFSSHLKGGLTEASWQPGRALIVDLQGVDLFGSAALRALMQCHEQGAADGIPVRLVSTNRIVVRSLTITKLDKVLALYPTVSAALRPDR